MYAHAVNKYQHSFLYRSWLAERTNNCWATLHYRAEQLFKKTSAERIVCGIWMLFWWPIIIIKWKTMTTRRELAEMNFKSGAIVLSVCDNSSSMRKFSFCNFASHFWVEYVFAFDLSCCFDERDAHHLIK